MKRRFPVAIAALLFAAAWCIASPGKGAGKKQTLSPEEALDGFFDGLDRQSTSLLARDEPAPEPPDIRERQELQARFAARLAHIDRLRTQGMAGETNRGFLEARRTPSNADQARISEENTDRLAVYEAIAAQCKSSVDAVGRQRARKINQLCKRGVWVQDPAGQWSQKIRMAGLRPRAR